MFSHVKEVICLLLFVWFVVGEDGPEVEMANGKLKGKYMLTRRGRKFSGFLGIPYAKPPVGDLRFEPPVLPDSWEGVRDATEDSAICYQRNPYTRSETIEGDEDCLYLNVYTPQLPSYGSDPLPVMVFFHGGGWVCGAGISKWYGPDLLLERDVVLVVPNFRLGPLGFLSTQDAVVPGNNGLKDQTLVLKWIRENIEHFGGDFNKVTAFGESAGGASVEFHMMSPLSKGLVHAGISQSGTSMCSWALAPENEPRRNAEKLAKSLSCPTESSEEMVECLKKIDARDIIDKDNIFWEWDYDPMIPFKPVIEHEHAGAFLTEHPVDAFKRGHVEDIPWITGITQSEGALRIASLVTLPHLLEEFKRDFDKLAPISMFYAATSPDKDSVTQKLKEFYLTNDSIADADVQNFVDLFTDSWFLSALDESINLHLKYLSAPVYLYYFNHRGVASFSQVFGDPHRNYGVCHADELQYMFPVGDGLFPDQKPDECDKNVAEIVTSLWASFAKTGIPTADTNELIPTTWEPVTSDTFEYIHIGNDSDIRMEKNLLPERRQFWKTLPTRLNKVTDIKDEFLYYNLKRMTRITGESGVKSDSELKWE